MAEYTAKNVLLKDVGDGSVVIPYTDKQDPLTEAQLAAANSGITTDKVTSYDTHIGDGTIHVTADDKTAWNNKVDKVTGKSLISDTEIERLANVTNYDDSEVMMDISDLQSDVQDINTELAKKANTTDVSAALANKQDTLVSGTNIKTINNNSILGEGNITIQGGGATITFRKWGV